MTKGISKEEWVKLSKKLRERVSAHFKPEELEIIDQFIQYAGQGAAFDQVQE